MSRCTAHSGRCGGGARRDRGSGVRGAFRSVETQRAAGAPRRARRHDNPPLPTHTNRRTPSPSCAPSSRVGTFTYSLSGRAWRVRMWGAPRVVRHNSTLTVSHVRS